MFGVADERLGEVPAAVVYCEKGGLDAEALLAFLAGAARPVQAAGPYLVRATSRLPKLGTGKIDKVSLRAHIGAQRAGVTAGQPRPLAHWTARRTT